MDNKTNMFIFTCNSKHGDLTVYEFKKYDATYSFVKWLDDGVGIAETQLTQEEMYDVIMKSPIIFVRHIFFIIDIPELDGYMERIVSLCRSRIAYNESFCIQARWSKKPCVDVTDISKNIADVLANDGYTLDVPSGEMIVSVYVDSERIYVGINEARYNLSHWKGGMPHYSPTEEYDFVSRAEYKLLEAIECFDIDMSDMANAADLGAAPGGWTKVLTDRGLNCVSIDPNKLDESIIKSEKVKYYRMPVETYLKLDSEDKFDIIVNDMKMNADRSVDIMNTFYRRMNDNAIAVMTFKLPQRFSYKNDILDIIKRFRKYTLIGARQLFHNRSEITVVLKRLPFRRNVFKGASE